MHAALSDEIDHFLRTGRFDPLFSQWPGSNTIECATQGSHVLREALLDDVRRREASRPERLSIRIPDHDLADFARAKVEPMVRGLFPKSECERVLALFEASVVFLTREETERRISSESLDTAWELAHIYLTSIGAERLDAGSMDRVGLSVNTTCYVSVAYFDDDDPFSDFLVHEAAHVFHNCKRRTVGLPHTRHREWLLPIAFQKRETFAYACEAFSCIVAQAQTREARQTLLETLKAHPPPPDPRVEWSEYVDILSLAVNRRNGWKAILERCSG